MFSSEQLDAIDQEAQRAPPTELRWRARQLRMLLGSPDRELREHAQALLLKIEYLIGLALVLDAPAAACSTQERYLAPDLVLPTADQGWSPSIPVACRCGGAQAAAPMRVAA
jgi:hypothetical protein